MDGRAVPEPDGKEPQARMIRVAPLCDGKPFAGLGADPEGASSFLVRQDLAQHPVDEVIGFPHVAGQVVK